MIHCDVCGSLNEVQELDCSLSGDKYNYCLECLKSGRHVYKEVVNYGVDCFRQLEDINMILVAPTLDYYGISEEQYIKDVESCKLKGGLLTC